jgi:hypothetical protein
MKSASAQQLATLLYYDSLYRSKLTHPKDHHAISEHTSGYCDAATDQSHIEHLHCSLQYTPITDCVHVTLQSPAPWIVLQLPLLPAPSRYLLSKNTLLGLYSRCLPEASTAACSARPRRSPDPPAEAMWSSAAAAPRLADVSSAAIGGTSQISTLQRSCQAQQAHL